MREGRREGKQRFCRQERQLQCSRDLLLASPRTFSLLYSDAALPLTPMALLSQSSESALSSPSPSPPSYHSPASTPSRAHHGADLTRTLGMHVSSLPSPFLPTTSPVTRTLVHASARF